MCSPPRVPPPPEDPPKRRHSPPKQAGCPEAGGFPLTGKPLGLFAGYLSGNCFLGLGPNKLRGLRRDRRSDKQAWGGLQALQGHHFVCHCLLPGFLLLLCLPQDAEGTAGIGLPVAGRHQYAFPRTQMFCFHGQGLDLLKQGLGEGTGCSASHSCLRIRGRIELCLPCSPWLVSGRGDCISPPPCCCVVRGATSTPAKGWTLEKVAGCGFFFF